MQQSGLFGLSDHWRRRSANDHPLEELFRILARQRARKFRNHNYLVTSENLCLHLKFFQLG